MSDILTGAPAVNLIAGQWVPSRGASVRAHRSPLGPSEALGRRPSSRGGDVAAAVAAAAATGRAWSRQDV